jgi:hypothetical protein
VKLRNGFIAFLLAFLTALAGPLLTVTRAQSDTSPVPLEKGAGTSEAFVIYQNAAGDTICRVATAVERRRISGREGTMHTIYEGAPRRAAVGDSGLDSLVSSGKGTEALLPSAGLRIVLHGTAQLEQSPEAKQAFIVAANRWEALISTPITVVIDVDFGTQFFGTDYPSPNILGQTGSSRVSAAYPGVRSRLISNNPTSAELALYNGLPSSSIPIEFGGTPATVSQVRMTRPVARALGLVADIANPDALAIGQGDSGIGFNSAFSFDFNPDDGIAPGKTDFDSVATHEIGHALGFSSDAGGANQPTGVSMWDLFRFRPGTANLGSIGTAQRVMSAGGEQVYFNNQTNSFGTQELGLSTGGPSGDATGGDGNQSSHWKADEQSGFYVGIMDPTLARGVRKTITSNDVKAIDAFGYSIGGTAPPPPPPPAAPSNDNFVSATVLPGVQGGGITGTNISATKEAGEPDPVPAVTTGGRSVWYNWTSPVNGTATFDTNGSDFDTVLAIYTGASVNSLSRLASNDDIDTAGEIFTSSVQFPVTAGTVYRITVDGFDGDTGNIQLNWTSTGTTPTPTPTPTPVPTPTPTPTPLPTPTPFFNVTGRVSDSNGIGVGGVRIGIAGPPLANGLQYQASTTASDGSYSVQNLSTGVVYTIAPILDGPFAFSPGSFTLSSGGANIIANFTTSPGNPIDGSSRFVTEHYRDFLGREPDASGLSFWTSEIEGCQGNLNCRAVKRINVSAAFFLSIEFQETGYLVERMYKVAYGDVTEPSTGLSVPVIRRQEFLQDTPLISQNVVVGVGAWQQQLESNKQAYALAFVGRQRFTDAYPAGMTPLQFVTKLNTNTGGALTQAQVDALVAELSANDTAAGRAGVLRKVAENAEVDRREKNRAFVLMQYYGYLRRDPNAAPDSNFAGWNFWLSKLNQFNGNFVSAEMVKAFLESTEYRSRF